MTGGQRSKSADSVEAAREVDGMADKSCDNDGA